MSDLPDSYDHHLAAAGVGDRALPHCRRWASLWLKADGPASPDRTTAFFDALGRSTGIAEWQFRQALQAIRILATDSLALPWAADFPWASLADQARHLPPSHRTLLRETHSVPAAKPQNPARSSSSLTHFKASLVHPQPRPRPPTQSPALFPVPLSPSPSSTSPSLYPHPPIPPIVPHPNGMPDHSRGWPSLPRPQAHSRTDTHGHRRKKEAPWKGCQKRAPPPDANRHPAPINRNTTLADGTGASRVERQ